MSAYAVGFCRIRDASWRKSYLERTMKLVEKHSGRFLVRLDCPWEVLEGKPPHSTGMVMIKFPSMEEARAWYNDPDYQPLIKLRQSGSTLDLILVESL